MSVSAIKYVSSIGSSRKREIQENSTINNVSTRHVLFLVFNTTFRHFSLRKTKQKILQMCETYISAGQSAKKNHDTSRNQHLAVNEKNICIALRSTRRSKLPALLTTQAIKSKQNTYLHVKT